MKRKENTSIQASHPWKSGVPTASKFIDGGAAYVMWRSRPRDSIAASDVFHLRWVAAKGVAVFLSSLCCILLITHRNRLSIQHKLVTIAGGSRTPT
jgi:hypothetical protein